VADGPLFDVAQAFTPFDERETRRMRRYRDKAKELSECEMLGASLTLDVKPGEKRDESGVTHEGGRALRSDLLMMFRPLYFNSKRDVSGFLKVAAMLRRHAEDKGGDAGEKAAEMIADYEAGHYEALAQANIFEIRVEGGEEVLSPKFLLKLFLHGGDFHMDERLADYLDGLDPISRSTFEFQYLGTVRELGVMYVRFASLPNSILHEPKLLPGAN
jgi:hypothetical protein